MSRRRKIKKVFTKIVSFSRRISVWSLNKYLHFQVYPNIFKFARICSRFTRVNFKQRSCSPAPLLLLRLWPHPLAKIWGQIWLNLGEIWAKLRQNLGKIKILHRQKHSNSYGYGQNTAPLRFLFTLLRFLSTLLRFLSTLLRFLSTLLRFLSSLLRFSTTPILMYMTVMYY